VKVFEGSSWQQVVRVAPFPIYRVEEEERYVPDSPSWNKKYFPLKKNFL